MDYELAEVAILAAAMRDDTGRASAHALERLTNEDFTSPARQRMFETLSKLAPDANEVDLMMELPDISEEVTFVAEHYGGGKIDRYLDHVIENRNVRSLERALLVAQDGMTEGLPAEQIASSFNSSLAHAFSSRHGQVRMKEAAQEAHASFLSANAGDESAIPTGFSKLDKHLEGGLRPGRLYVIGARSGMRVPSTRRRERDRSSERKEFVDQAREGQARSRRQANDRLANHLQGRRSSILGERIRILRPPASGGRSRAGRGGLPSTPEQFGL